MRISDWSSDVCSSDLLSIRVDNGNMSVRKPRPGQQSGRGMQIIFRQAEGDECIVTATAGDNLMHVALANDIAGIPGDCGGQCACGTCHVYIDPAWVERIGSVAPGSTEEAMISGAPVDARPNSRLACQVNLTPLSDGLIVEIPEGQ